jgi:GNAT superfamily N-acetyltransferase
MTEKKPVRHRMKMTTSSLPTVAKEGCRNILTEDAEKLGHLMVESYRGTIDQKYFGFGEPPEECVEEMQGTLAGKYGDFLDFASFLIEDAQGIQSASIITLFEGRPLLAYTMTAPDSKGKGMAESLIKRSIDALAQHGHTELYLCVTEGNPAEKLYEKIGFIKHALPEPKKPEPSQPPKI